MQPSSGLQLISRHWLLFDAVWLLATGNILVTTIDPALIVRGFFNHHIYCEKGPGRERDKRKLPGRSERQGQDSLPFLYWSVGNPLRRIPQIGRASCRERV